MALPLYYNWRNLWVRKLSTALTFAVVAVVVLVLAVLLSFAAGIRASLAASGSPYNLVVLKPGATAESTSIIQSDELDRLVQTPGVARNAAGELLISRELSTQTSIPRIGPGGAMANVAVRGVDDVAFDIHMSFKLVEGRRFEQGLPEIIVGRAASQRYANLSLGGETSLGRLANRTFKVVGIYEASGGAIESEIWGGRTVLADAYARNVMSSALVRLSDAADVDAAIAYIKSPAVELEAKREPDYYRDLSKTTRDIVGVTTILIGIMAIGAIFAVANTMYATVDRRQRELAMLRTLGFQRDAIRAAILIESLLICIMACAFGLALSLPLNGNRQDFFSDTTFTVLAYELKVTPQIIAAALIVATLVGVGGALAPAWRASRIRVIEALRKA